jgi:hypothetical protein
MLEVRVKKSDLNNRLHVFLLPFGTSGMKQDLHRTGTEDFQETHRHSKASKKQTRCVISVRRATRNVQAGSRLVQDSLRWCLDAIKTSSFCLPFMLVVFSFQKDLKCFCNDSTKRNLDTRSRFFVMSHNKYKSEITTPCASQYLPCLLHSMPKRILNHIPNHTKLQAQTILVIVDLPLPADC